jgi:pimeloyl-ACP methyl ester carboxylesterase
MGGAASMDWWEDGFCARLAAGRRYVIRYDHRDTGRSVSYTPGAPPYGVADLAEDALGVLDALGVDCGHLVGMSMGGGIAQLVALDHTDRVASLTLIATAPAPPGPDDPDLPTMSEEGRARFAAARPPADWGDRQATIAYQVELARALASPAAPFDEAAARAVAARAFDRTTDAAAMMRNHYAIDSGGRTRDRVRSLAVPTLVVHGTDDPVLPYGNGLALANEIPGARLLTLDRTGHELPERTWDVLVPALLEHTRR